MNNQIPFVLGLLLFISVFAFCTIIVIGIKTIFLKIKQIVSPEKVVEKIKKRAKKRKSKAVTTTIEIDPTKVDKIYMKRTG